jgi:hypothetical protein
VVVKKLMSYGRYVLVMLLIVYLILAWMYFKDNAGQLTAFGLLLWFVIVPLSLFAFILALRWRQKKTESSTADAVYNNSEKERAKLPNTYRLFMYSSMCLPEGDNWSDVIDNNADLTLLSEDLTDFDGLPILTKPIIQLTDVAPLPYQYMHDTGLEDSDLNGLTLRLCSLIHKQLSLSDEVLSSIAQHFNVHNEQDTQLSISTLIGNSITLLVQIKKIMTNPPSLLLMAHSLNFPFICACLKAQTQIYSSQPQKSSYPPMVF